MSTIRTMIGSYESARRERFEPAAGITATNVQQAIEQAAGFGIGSTPVAFAASPYDVLPNDTLLDVDSTLGPVTINLRAASTRNGLALSIKDVAGMAATNAITIVPNVADTGGVDGLTSLPINSAYGGFRLRPATLRYVIAP